MKFEHKLPVFEKTSWVVKRYQINSYRMRLSIQLLQLNNDGGYNNNNNNNKWTFVMRQLQKCPVAQYRHNEIIQ